MNNVRVCGLMGMASFSDDMEKVRNEFRLLKKLFENHTGLTILSMGMSSDYKIAVEEGSTMVRIEVFCLGETEKLTKYQNCPEILVKYSYFYT